MWQNKRQTCEGNMKTNGKGIKRTERGWAGHFIGAHLCEFRRNTLIEYNDVKIVISTVGLMRGGDSYDTIGYNRYYETMAFHSDYSDTQYYDADVTKKIHFESEWAIDKIHADNEANIMHEKVVQEISEKLGKNLLKKEGENDRNIES